MRKSKTPERSGEKPASSPSKRPKPTLLASSPLDPEELQSLIALFRENGVSDFELKTKGLRLKVSLAGSRPSEPIVYAVPSASQIALNLPSQPTALPNASSVAGAAQPEPAAESPEAAQEKPGAMIVSPMVGTFYRAPAPDAEPFVGVGSAVSEDTVLCIIEAMKIMNEIKADMRGVVAEILVENGQPVEYGRPMFRIVAE